MWAFFRGVAGGTGVGMGVPTREALVGSPAAAALLAGAVIIVLRVELARRSELVFLGNLGFSFGRVAALIALECAVLETGLRLLVA